MLTINELTKAFCDAHADYYDVVCESTIRPLVRKMCDTGTLDRLGEPARNGQTRYRYFRKTRLEGPIVDIDRAMRADDSEAVG